MTVELYRARGVWSSILLATSLLGGCEALAQAPPQPLRNPVPAGPQAPAQTQQPDKTMPPQAQGSETGPITVPLKSNPSVSDWTKICGQAQGQGQLKGAEVCYTTRDFVADEGQQVIAVAVYDLMGGPQAGTKIVRFITPVSLLLVPGLRFAVDDAPRTAARYTICYPTGCYAEAAVTQAVVDTIKKGATLKVAVQNQVGREIILLAPLAGFSKVYDGPPLEPEALRKQQESYLEDLKRRAENIREKQLERGSGSSPVTPPSK
jgi:invasion protein IalB